MIYLLYVLHVMICIFLVLVVLLQQGKGADLSVFGGGATQAAFGARGAATLLHKLTVYGFIGFIGTTLAIGLMTRGSAGSTVMSGVEQEQTTTAPPPDPDAAAIDPDAAVEGAGAPDTAAPLDDPDAPPIEGDGGAAEAAAEQQAADG